MPESMAILQREIIVGRRLLMFTLSCKKGNNFSKRAVGVVHPCLSEKRSIADV